MQPTLVTPAGQTIECRFLALFLLSNHCLLIQCSAQRYISFLKPNNQQSFAHCSFEPLPPFVAAHLPGVQFERAKTFPSSCRHRCLLLASGLSLDAGLTSSRRPYALIFHAVQGGSLQSAAAALFQTLSELCARRPTGHPPQFRAGSSRFHEKEQGSPVTAAEHFIAKWMLRLAPSASL